MQRLNLILPSSLGWACTASWGNSRVFVSSMAVRKDFSTGSGSRPAPRIPLQSPLSLRMSSCDAISNGERLLSEEESHNNQTWNELLPFVDSSHRSATITVPIYADDDDIHFHPTTFSELLKGTVTALRDMKKSSVWVEVPMSRARLIEDMQGLGFEFHHAEGTMAKLNLWLHPDIPSKIPEYATHHLGVGAVVINSRDEILCIRELRQNYMPYKIPTGLSERGESIAEAAEREVLEETGIQAKFDSILSFRHTHGMAHGRSDIFFVCRLNPVEDDRRIPTPVPQACEVAEAMWLPLTEYRSMIEGDKDGKGHPMMAFVMNKIFDEGRFIDHKEVKSVVPGRKPTPMYFPHVNNSTTMMKN
ncbi:NUDIX domain containing protein [Nitzschia inconspicua]|uniref:NUDIX domain containing protein n=1 Tax=Nitzschia inconspicua TaxID=303405 RepID=A0A9K3KPA2_9STRA|nr:NUDIX domain containing protein [Nitzschia inconspicua]